MKTDTTIHQEVHDHLEWYTTKIEPNKKVIPFKEWCTIEVKNVTLKNNLKKQLKRAIEYNALFGKQIPTVTEVLSSWRIKL